MTQYAVVTCPPMSQATFPPGDWKLAGVRSCRQADRCRGGCRQDRAECCDLHFVRFSFSGRWSASLMFHKHCGPVEHRARVVRYSIDKVRRARAAALTVTGRALVHQIHIQPKRSGGMWCEQRCSTGSPRWPGERSSDALRRLPTPRGRRPPPRSQGRVVVRAKCPRRGRRSDYRCVLALSWAVDTTHHAGERAT